MLDSRIVHSKPIQNKEYIHTRTVCSTWEHVGRLWTNGLPVTKVYHCKQRKEDTQILRKLIQDGADIKCSDTLKQTSLHIAAYQGHLDTASFLIKCGADVNEKNAGKITSLHWAAQYNHPEMCELLLREGALLNEMDIVYYPLIDTNQSKMLGNYHSHSPQAKTLN